MIITIRNIYSSHKLIIIFFLSMLSGMPMGFFFGMLSAWLYDLGAAVTVIGLFATARTPFAFKFIWAPFIDHFKLPILYKLLGRRRSWMLLANIFIIIALFAMSYTKPTLNFGTAILVACVIGFFAATYDIAFDAFRIESLDDDSQAIGVATTILGYRLGMMLVSAGSLLLAHNYGWEICFIAVIVIFALGGLVIVLAREPLNINSTKDNDFTDLQAGKEVQKSLSFAKIFAPFKEFFARKYAITILLMVILYKLGDAMLSAMTTPFYRDIGFEKNTIAYISKIYGVIATIAGSYLGAFISKKMGNLRSLLLCGTAQMLSNFMFVWQNHMGADSQALILTLAVENITGGMGSAALLGYMSALCNKQFTATHYALLSSFATFSSTTLSASSGYWVKILGWNWFFVMTVIISLPALILVRYLDHKIERIN